MVISKEEFVKYIEFIKEKERQQTKLADTFEELCPGFYCDTLVYCDYENKLLDLLIAMFEDDTEIITYKLYELDNFTKEEQEEQFKETPELTTWETVYDYLVERMDKKHGKD